MAQICKSIV